MHFRDWPTVSHSSRGEQEKHSERARGRTPLPGGIEAVVAKCFRFNACLHALPMPPICIYRLQETALQSVAHPLSPIRKSVLPMNACLTDVVVGRVKFATGPFVMPKVDDGRFERRIKACSSFMVIVSPER